MFTRRAGLAGLGLLALAVPLLLLRGAEAPRLDHERLLTEVAGSAAARYYDPGRINAREMVQAALDALERVLDEALVTAAPGGFGARLELSGQLLEVPLAGLEERRGREGVAAWRAALAPILDFVAANYQGERPSLEDVVYLLINAGLAKLDPHTTVFTPRVWQDFEKDTSGELIGIGALIGEREGRLTIITPLAGSPALAAGLRPRDVIIEIDGESTINLDTWEAVSRIRGPRGEPVLLTVRRGDEPPEVKSVPRDLINIPSTSRLAWPGGFGYLRLASFQSNTMEQLRAALGELAAAAGAEGLKGLVLDLRQNHGGLLQTAQEAADLFLAEGVIVATAGLVGPPRVEEAAWAGTEPRYPVAVIVDAESASAAEILAGALQKNDRALVLGATTFGKGSVQELFPILGGATRLKMTTRQYFLPDRSSIQGVGVVPDVALAGCDLRENESTIYTPARHLREADYQSSLQSSGPAATGQPVLAVSYPLPLPPTPAPGEPTPEPDEDLSVYTGEIDQARLERDFPVQLALRLLALGAADAEPWSRAGFLERHRADLEREAQEGQARIAAALARRNVDWSAPATPAPAVPAAPELGAPQALAARAAAGEELVLTLRAANFADGLRCLLLTGGGAPGLALAAAPAGPLCRLRAVLAAPELGFLDNRELLLGRVAAGELREGRLVVKVPETVLTQQGDFTVAVNAEGWAAPVVLRGRLQLAGRPRPAFACSWLLADDGRNGSQGNGDGAPQVGERLALLLRVRNVGAGPAKAVSASLVNRSGRAFYLREGRLELRDLNPGDEREVAFLFDFAAAGEEPLRLGLNLLDQTYGEYFGDEVRLAAGQRPAADWTRRDPPRLVLDDRAALEGALVAGARLVVSGRAESAAGLKQVAIFVNDDKVFRAAPAADAPAGAALPFRAELELKEGANVITFGATDRQDLRSSLVLVVRRADAPSPPAATATPAAGPPPVKAPPSAAPATPAIPAP